MGAMKELMIEAMYDRGHNLQLEVSFLCPECRHPSAAYVTFPAGEDHVVEEVECLNPDEYHKWDVSLRESPNGVRATLNQHPEERVSVSVMDTSDDWTDPFPEPGSYGIFLGALDEWRGNVTDLGKVDGGSSRNRMLFTTLYSIVEAYLSDTIIGAALADQAVQKHMLTLDGLKGVVVSLETVLEQPNIVRDMVKNALQGMSFHNLPAVNAICKVAFSKTILPEDKVQRALVMQSVNKRHDCVHRNGKDKDGNVHVDITQDYLRELGTIFESMAEILENAMTEAQVARFFEDLGPE